MVRLLLAHCTRIALALALFAALTGIGVLAGLWSVAVANVLLLILLVIAITMALIIGRVYRQTALDLASATDLHAQLQAVVAMQNRGYMLFSDHGELLETRAATGLLGIDKLGHFDDLVNAVRDGADLMSHFRRLQQIGEPFGLKTVAPKSGKHLNIRGERQRLPDGTVFDSLWIRDDTELQTVKDQAAKLIAAANGLQSEWRAALDHLPFPVWIKDNDLRLLWVNQAYERALGVSHDDIMIQQIELGNNLRTLAAKAMSTRLPQSVRQHVVMHGQRRLMQLTYLVFDAGEKAMLAGCALDVTAEEEKEAALERHLKASEDVLENIGTPVAIYGPDKRLEFYNRAYVKMWDHNERFLQSKPTLGEIIEDLRARRRAPEQADFAKYKREREALFTSLVEPREDMLYLPNETMLRVVAMPHPMGGVMFVHEDITDRMALETSYNTLMAVQRETLDHLAEGIAVFGSDGRLKLYNPAYQQIWKLANAALQDEPHIGEVMETLKPLYRFEQWPLFKSTMIAETLDRKTRTERLELTDDRIVTSTTVPLPDGGVLCSYLDVTDSARVEQALRTSNMALAAADKLKSEFVANVSYQLRTPLSTIMGFAEILTNQYFGTLNERQMDYARTMMESSKRLKALIDDVLDLATIEAGRMELDRHPVAIAQLLQSVTQLVKERARQNQLDIAIDCEANIGRFTVDEKRIKQVLFNLLSNAIHYTPAGGRITLRARKLGAWVHVSVIDTGIGISPGDQQRIWGKFERGKHEQARQGAGLGLSLVRHLIELHGGRVELQSELDHGTTVSCILPVHPPDAP